MKLSEKKKSVAGKMKVDGSEVPKAWAKSSWFGKLPKHQQRSYMNDANAYKQKGRASLTPVKHKVDVAGQESYKEEDK